jgi:putative pyruvate formate lyase activating enzyme
MQRQVGDLRVEGGLATRGLLIRHLVLPGDLAGSREVLRFVAEELSRDAWINLMDQYYPAYRAYDYPELRRGITAQEYATVVAWARELGLHRGIPLGGDR